MKPAERAKRALKRIDVPGHADMSVCDVCISAIVREINEAVAEAKAEQREECAKIADYTPSSHETIAASIRKGCAASVA